jgi:NarL family two-component system response regulator LiaR
VVLTSHASEEDVFPALKAGAVGYLLKHSAPDDVLRAIRQAHAGETVLHPAIARMVLQDLRRAPKARQREPVDPLSERELEVLRLVARGMSNQEIADALVVGEATVRSHVSAILRKLQLASRTQAALYALREGLASLDESGPSQPQPGA